MNLNILDNILYEKKTNNFYNLKNKRSNKAIKINLKKVLLPFGLDQEYDHYYLKFELNENNSNHTDFLDFIRKLEEKIKLDFQCNDEDFKPLLKKRDDKQELLVCRLKQFKKNIQLQIKFQDEKNNYLKTAFDLPKQSFMDIEIELNNLWDFRKQSSDNNKLGLLIYVSKVYVYA
jgi:hypothetical protein